MMIVKIQQAPIGYTGEVTLTMLDEKGMAGDKKIIKNNGVNNLFKLFCQFLNGSLLSGSDTNEIVQTIKNKLPRFLAIGSPESVAPTSIEMNTLQDETELGLEERFPLVNNGTWFVDANGLVCIQFSCNIPYTSVGSAQIKEMGLFASPEQGTNDMLARITLASGAEQGVQIIQGQSILINWRIYFANKAISTEE
jgi:hypothetical protein